MKAEKKPNLEFGEENICPVCGSSNIKVEIEYLKDNKDIQVISKTCHDKKCLTNWGYKKDLNNNRIFDFFIFHN